MKNLTTICYIKHNHTTDCVEDCVNTCRIEEHHTKKKCSCDYIYTGIYHHYVYEYKNSPVTMNSKLLCKYNINGIHKCVFLSIKYHTYTYYHYYSKV